jgi:hypothetical protein
MTGPTATSRMATGTSSKSIRRAARLLDGFATPDGTPNDDFPRNEGR